ncbi:hypothetical protein B0H34DRAFT_408033 [Crassisporium funariophilum]|nr:hypothetical protein B0H34DRAFT_408033 [Crassisporium funariophilum]
MKMPPIASSSASGQRGHDPDPTTSGKPYSDLIPRSDMKNHNFGFPLPLSNRADEPEDNEISVTDATSLVYQPYTPSISLHAGLMPVHDPSTDAPRLPTETTYHHLRPTVIVLVVLAFLSVFGGIAMMVISKTHWYKRNCHKLKILPACFPCKRLRKPAKVSVLGIEGPLSTANKAPIVVSVVVTPETPSPDYVIDDRSKALVSPNPSILVGGFAEKTGVQASELEAQRMTSNPEKTGDFVLVDMLQYTSNSAMSLSESHLKQTISGRFNSQFALPMMKSYRESWNSLRARPEMEASVSSGNSQETSTTETEEVDADLFSNASSRSSTTTTVYESADEDTEEEWEVQRVQTQSVLMKRAVLISSCDAVLHSH